MSAYIYEVVLLLEAILVQYAPHIANVGGLIWILPAIRWHLAIVLVFVSFNYRAGLNKDANIFCLLSLLVFEAADVRWAILSHFIRFMNIQVGCSSTDLAEICVNAQILVLFIKINWSL